MTCPDVTPFLYTSERHTHCKVGTLVAKHRILVNGPVTHRRENRAEERSGRQLILTCRRVGAGDAAPEGGVDAYILAPNGAGSWGVGDRLARSSTQEMDTYRK